MSLHLFNTRASKLPIVSRPVSRLVCPDLGSVVVINCQVPLAHGREWVATLGMGRHGNLPVTVTTNRVWIQVVGLLYCVCAAT